MKSCFGIIILASLLALIVGVGGLLYYLSSTSEFTRSDQTAAPAARPVR